ncbi:DUF6452 family protein [Croceivirga thetidis]|uniref:DUF1735 domain-containing protein n=1 Tax=Croceivirga thetidis TaxID=2721623 RepID=A0ABX1GX80_9FLAO|nr:DUF6452 family protein [Croceivirga thetidis]NKI33535.1 hypothetical protein [Croceivirga thetidis]
MRKVARVFLLVFAVSILANCEKDDICVGGDTPLLVIGFFDATDETLEKQAISLRIRALDVDEPINYDASIDTEVPPFHRDRSNTDSTAIPLKVNANSTAFQFILNSDDDDETNVEIGNIDTLTFNYTVVEDFISRGCGFVANFDDLLFELNTDTDNWIQNVIVEDTTIENSTAIHVKIYH